MAKFLLLLAIFAFIKFSTASENTLEQDGSEIPLQIDLDTATPDQTVSMVEKMYRSTMVTVLKQKVMDVQRKVVRGENALPEAIDILKITLLSQPTNNVNIRKAAETVFSKISPQLGKAAGTITALLDDPKESPKSQ